MPTSLAPVDIANMALDRIGSQAINSLLGNDPSSLACNRNFIPATLIVARAARWNCILSTAILTSITQTPLPNVPPNPIVTGSPWAPNTAYLANVYVTFGGYYYQVTFNYTSSASFINDLTAGHLVQTDQQTASNNYITLDGSNYPSGWAFEYALPADFQLLVALNDNTAPGWQCYGFGETTSDYEIIGGNLFCSDSQAVIQYIQNQPDTTRFDSLFVDALVYKLASMISTSLRQDGGAMERTLVEAYNVLLRQARTKNSGERQSRRFNPIASSKFNQARWRGING